MAKIESGNIISRESYLFENQAGKESKILEAIKAEANARRRDVQIGVQTMKSGGLFLGTKEAVITVTCSSYNPIYIITRSVGTFLYVSIVTMAVLDFSKVENIFKTESFNAYWNACVSTLQTALANLGFEQYTKKFTGI